MPRAADSLKNIPVVRLDTFVFLLLAASVADISELSRINKHSLDNSSALFKMHHVVVTYSEESGGFIDKYIIILQMMSIL